MSELAEEYSSYNDLDGWKYDDDEYLYIFWRKGFGTEVSVFEKLTESDLVRWYKKRKAEEERYQKRIREIRNKRLKNKNSSD